MLGKERRSKQAEEDDVGVARLTMRDLVLIRDEAMADDLEIELEKMSLWSKGA